MRTNNTINTIRALANRLYGENKWSLESGYDKKGMPVNWKKTYSLNGIDFMTVSEMCKILEMACEKTGR